MASALDAEVAHLCHCSWPAVRLQSRKREGSPNRTVEVLATCNTCKRTVYHLVEVGVEPEFERPRPTNRVGRT